MTSDEELELCRLVERAMQDTWEDGKKRPRLQRVMQGRFGRLGELRGTASLEALRLSDRAMYGRFLHGCWRAFVRDGLISAGMLGGAELQAMKARLLHQEHHGDAPPPQEHEAWFP